MNARALMFAVALVACAGTEGTCELSRPPPEAALVVLQSDYISTRVVLGDEQGRVVDANFLSSGTCVSGLVSSLSGDVVLPTQPFAEQLAFIDRRNTDVLTLVAHNGSVRQLDLRQERGPGQVRTGASPNAMDALSLTTSRGVEYWISRHDPNRSPLARIENRGNDIVVLNSDGLFVESIACQDSDAGAAVALARPEKMISVVDDDGKTWVVVALARLSESFSESGPGAFCLVDPETLGSRTFELPLLDSRVADFRNCGLVHATSANSAPSIAILCRGATFAGADDRRRSSGLFSFHLDRGDPVIDFAWRAADSAQMPVPSGSLLALGRDTLLAVSRADAGGHDRWVKYVIASSSQTPSFEVLYEARTAFVLGDAAARELSTEHTRVYLPDADQNALLIRDMRRDAAGVWLMESESTSPLPTGGLPPRAVAWARR